MIKKVKYLIVGGGLSGVVFANTIKDNYIILEKTNRLGGFCKSFKVNNFVWDCGGHFFHTQSPQYYEYLLKRQGTINIKKDSKIKFQDHYIDYPFQNNIKQLPTKYYKKCIKLYNRRRENKQKNLLEELNSKYGKGIVNLFLKPYNEKLYCVSIKKLCKTSMGRFFPKFSLDENIKCRQYNDQLYYNINGIETMLDVFFKSIDVNNVLFNCFYTQIDKEKRIVYTNQGSIEYEYLINTTPFDKFYEMLEYNDYLKNKEHFKANKVLLFNLGFNKPSEHEYNWIYCPSKQYNFYRVGFYNNVVHSNKKSMYVEISLKRDAKININKQFKLTIKNLKKAKLISDNDKLEAFNYIIMDPAYVHINDKSNNIVAEKREQWKNLGIHVLGRYGRWEYSCMEDAILEAQKLGKELKEGIQL